MRRSLENRSIPARILAAALLVASSLQAATPLVTLDFQKSSGTAVSSAEGTYSLSIRDGASIATRGPVSGGGSLVVEGGAKPVEVGLSSPLTDFKGDELSFSMWLRPDSLATDAPVAFGYSIDPDVPADEARLAWRLPTIPTSLTRYDLWSAFEGEMATGTWHHVAFRYSVSNATFAAWLDGRPQRFGKVEDGRPSPVKGLFETPFCAGFKGAVADIRLWKGSLPDEQLLSFRPDGDWAKETAAAFSRASFGTGHKPFATWCKRLAGEVDAMSREEGTVSVREWMRIRSLARKLPKLREYADQLAKGEGCGDAPFLPLSVYPYSGEKRLPWKLPTDGVPAETVRLAAARGEFEATSLVLFPLGDLAAFHMAPTGLTNGEGGTLPASAVDIRAVVVWFAPSLGWNSSGIPPRSRGFGTLTPELLVHDDALVRFDPETRSNWLRLSYPGAEKYVDVSKRGDIRGMECFDHLMEPVVDAKSFRPMSLKDGMMRQLWITVRIPADAAGGIYEGRLEMTVDGKPAGYLPLEVEVRPYRLPRARTRHDIDLPYYGAWMNDMGLGGHSFTNAVLRYRAQVRNMHEHNMDYPRLASPIDADDNPSPALQHRIALEEGIAPRPLFLRSAAIDGEWCCLDEHDKGKVRYPDEEPEVFARCMEDFKASFGHEISNIVSVVGHPDVFLYGWDEAPAHFVFRELPFFTVARSFGARPYVTSGPFSAAFGLSANDRGGYSRSHSRRWHESGALVWTYGCPFSGPENPAIWRRTKGMRLYMANGDGLFEYTWSEGRHIWNDFPGPSSYKNFNMVYPTLDGCIDTMAWESLREGFDDVRYHTLLRLLARAAIRSGDRDLVRLGKRAYAWGEAVDPELVDLDDMRVAADGWIRRLLEGLGKAGIETAAFQDEEVP